MLLPLLLNNLLETSGASVSASGTLSGSTEAQIRTGGRTLILTLTNDTWVASGAAFNAQRQNIIDGVTSAQSEALGWNNEVRDNESVTSVVRTSDTVVTITWSAAPNYDITADETITVTVPASALTGGAQLIASEQPTISFIPEPSQGGHFLPAGIKSGRIKPKRAVEAAEEIVEEIIAEVMEDETRDRPMLRVSRPRRDLIIERTSAEIASRGVFIGEITAIERAVTRMARVALDRRRELLRASQARQREREAIKTERDALTQEQIDEENAIITAILLRIV